MAHFKPLKSKYGKLTPISPQFTLRKQTFVRFLCDCGTEKTLAKSDVVRGTTLSCGCVFRDRAEKHLVQGKIVVGRKIPEYNVWIGMKHRCYNPNDKKWARYGGRGIGVCPEWKNSFATFLQDMGLRPSDKHSLNRKDNDLGYSRSNCAWATQKEQCRNKSNNRMITYKSKTATVNEWSEISGTKRATIAFRLDRGWSVQDSIFGKTKGEKLKDRRD